MRAAFVSDDGIEVPSVTAAEMREIDRIAVEETGPNLFQMMENAGRNLAEFVMERLGTSASAREVVVLAGAGGNGGGGICAARHLANHGIRVWLRLADAERLGSVPAQQRRIFLESGGLEVPRGQPLHGRPDLVVDALIGYSLAGAPRGATADLIAWANGSGAPVLALDLPSGLDATSDEAPGAVIRARWTMTLALPKTGLLPERTGELVLADIGIPAGVYRRMGLPYRTPFDHRYRVGLVVREGRT
jgi:NAD(P)H-hydrate epimerase